MRAGYQGRAIPVTEKWVGNAAALHPCGEANLCTPAADLGALCTVYRRPGNRVGRVIFITLHVAFEAPMTTVH